MVAGLSSIAILVAPYSAFGRIAQNLFAPIYAWGNNLLAFFAERAESYAFYSTDVVIGSIGTFAVAAVTFIIVAVLASLIVMGKVDIILKLVPLVMGVVE